jgi:hypothetical protein
MKNSLARKSFGKNPHLLFHEYPSFSPLPSRCASRHRLIDPFAISDPRHSFSGIRTRTRYSHT